MEELVARVCVLNLSESSAAPFGWSLALGQPSEGGGLEHCALWGAVGWGERSPCSPQVAGLGLGCAASISQQAVWPGYAQHLGSMTEPAAPSWWGWFLCAGGAGAGEAAGALAHSGMGMGVSAPPLP